MIGTGAMGSNHAGMYASLKDYCRLAGVYDIDYQRAASVAEKYGSVAYKSLQELLKQVDAVTVAVPTPLHYKIGMQCIRQHIHVLMEKPIAETVRQAQTLIKSAKENGVLLHIGHIELFNPTVGALKQLLAGKEIVSIELSRFRPHERLDSDVDVVKDTMIHDIYIVFYLLGRQIRNIYALGKQINNRTKHAAALLKLQSGEIVQLASSYLYHEKIRTIRVVTKQSIIIADLLKRTVQQTDLSNHSCADVPIPEQDALKSEIIHYIESINGNQTPIVTGEDGLATLSLANKIIRKIEASCRTNN